MSTHDVVSRHYTLPPRQDNNHLEVQNADLSAKEKTSRIVKVSNF